MEFTLETGGSTIKAHKESMALQQAGAADFSRSPAVKVMGIDSAALAALTPEQVRGKVLVLDFPEGSNAMAITRQLPAIATRLQPALVVLLCACGPPANNSSLLRELSSSTATPVFLLWYGAVRGAFGSGKRGPSEATVSVFIPPP